MSTLGNLTPSVLSGSGAPYCTGQAFLDYCDIRPYADLLSDTGYRAGGGIPNPDPNVIANSPRLYRLLMSASGEVESACMKGEIYRPVDLATLTTYPAGLVTGVTEGTTITTITTPLQVALVVGQGLSIINVGGATQVNGNFYVTGILSFTSFTILTPATSAYTGGGTFQATTLSNSGEMVQRIVAGIAAGYLFERRPDKAPQEIIGWAREKLQALKNGEDVLGPLPQQQAGYPSHHVDTPRDVINRNLIETVMGRFYGQRVNLRGSRNAPGANPGGYLD
jgi:hypothetical protein